uniref:Uncharacterized protein n=1 Tax=Cacopsylla melanoneura TaxID=428564 RepID=A0A8D8WX91_9HEMI
MTVFLILIIIIFVIIIIIIAQIIFFNGFVISVLVFGFVLVGFRLNCAQTGYTASLAAVNSIVCYLGQIEYFSIERISIFFVSQCDQFYALVSSLARLLEPFTGRCLVGG